MPCGLLSSWHTPTPQECPGVTAGNNLGGLASRELLQWPRTLVCLVGALPKWRRSTSSVCSVV